MEELKYIPVGRVKKPRIKILEERCHRLEKAMNIVLVASFVLGTICGIMIGTLIK